MNTKKKWKIYASMISPPQISHWIANKITTILSRNSCIIIMFIVIIQINPSIHQLTYTPHSFLCINNYDIKSRYDYYLKFNISHSLTLSHLPFNFNQKKYWVIILYWQEKISVIIDSMILCHNAYSFNDKIT